MSDQGRRPGHPAHLKTQPGLSSTYTNNGTDVPQPRLQNTLHMRLMTKGRQVVRGVSSPRRADWREGASSHWLQAWLPSWGVDRALR